MPLSDERLWRTRSVMRSSASEPVTMGVVTTGSVGVRMAPSNSASRNGIPSRPHSTPVATANINAMPIPTMTTIHRTFARQ